MYILQDIIPMLTIYYVMNLLQLVTINTSHLCLNVNRCKQGCDLPFFQLINLLDVIPLKNRCSYPASATTVDLQVFRFSPCSDCWFLNVGVVWSAVRTWVLTHPCITSYVFAYFANILFHAYVVKVISVEGT